MGHHPRTSRVRLQLIYQSFNRENPLQHCVYQRIESYDRPRRYTKLKNLEANIMATKYTKVIEEVRNHLQQVNLNYKSHAQIQSVLSGRIGNVTHT